MSSNVTIIPSDSARNLGDIFDSSLTITEHSSVSKSCFISIRDLRRIRNNLYSTTAKTIATSLIHSKDYRIATLAQFLLNLPLFALLLVLFLKLLDSFHI